MPWWSGLDAQKCSALQQHVCLRDTQNLAEAAAARKPTSNKDLELFLQVGKDLATTLDAWGGAGLGGVGVGGMALKIDSRFTACCFSETVIGEMKI